jgi:hypothetical protein
LYIVCGWILNLKTAASIGDNTEDFNIETGQTDWLKKNLEKRTRTIWYHLSLKKRKWTNHLTSINKNRQKEELLSSKKTEQ